MNLWKKVKLLFKINAVLVAVEKEKKMGYDIKVGIAKALRNFFITACAVAAAAVFAYFAIPDNLTPILGFLPDTIEHLIIPIISSFFVFALNWLKERD